MITLTVLNAHCEVGSWLLVSDWLHLSRGLLMGAGRWDSRCDPGTSSSHRSSPFTQVRRWGRNRGHGGHPSHRSPSGWGFFCTTFRSHPGLLQRNLCFSYLVGGGLPAHQQPVRHLLSPVSHAELRWADERPLCAGAVHCSKQLELQHTPGMFMPLRVWSWLETMMCLV